MFVIVNILIAVIIIIIIAIYLLNNNLDLLTNWKREDIVEIVKVKETTRGLEARMMRMRMLTTTAKKVRLAMRKSC